MAGLGDIFGRGSIGEQLFVWGLLSQLVQALTEPGVDELRMLMASATTIEPLSPSQLATLVNRGFIDAARAHSEGSKAGLDAGRMNLLIDLAGEAPGPAELVEALRRGIINENGEHDGLPSFTDGIRQGNLRDTWAPLYKALAVQLPSWSDALDALLEGQLDHDTALHWFTIAGGDPAAFQWLFDTRGTSPTPDMLGVMANRGIIEWAGTGPDAVTFAQGFLEGPWRNKWEPAMRKLQAYHPPPRTVTAMLRDGSLTQAEALTLFKQQGLSPELAAAYVKSAEHHSAVSAKELTKADIESLYTSHAVSKDEAAKMLTELGYSATHADVLLSGVDLRRTISNTTSAITRVRSLYTARKLQHGAAAAALKLLGVSGAQATELLATWDIELAATVRQLTEGQIVAAHHYGVIETAEAMSELVAIGYVPRDAWILLSTREQGKLPGEPAAGPGQVGVI